MIKQKELEEPVGMGMCKLSWKTQKQINQGKGHRNAEKYPIYSKVIRCQLRNFTDRNHARPAEVVKNRLCCLNRVIGCLQHHRIMRTKCHLNKITLRARNIVM